MIVHNHKRRHPDRSKDLKAYLNSPTTFEAIPRKFSMTYSGQYTVLIEDVRRGNDHLAAHVWMPIEPGAIPITALDKPIRFIGIVRPYLRKPVNGKRQQAYGINFERLVE